MYYRQARQVLSRQHITSTILKTSLHRILRFVFHTQNLLHTDAFAQKLLHTGAFTYRDFYTQTLLHTDAFIMGIIPPLDPPSTSIYVK